MITLPPEIITALQDHAFASYPGECCGLLFAPAGSNGVSRSEPLENVADRLHQRDPIEYPRTSRDAFAVNEAKMARLVREAQSGGLRWLAFYHSHIDCAAYYSAEDKRFAAPNGNAIFPEVLQIVISCHAQRIVDANVFKWDGTDFALDQPLPVFARNKT
jgi:proteasome lid subunit RPN8/RPN11